MPSVTSMVLLPGWRMMINVIARSPRPFM